MLRQIKAAIMQWHERRRAIRNLAAMPDHLLADIGIERHAIDAVVSGLQNRRKAAGSPRPQVLSNGRIALHKL